MTFELTPLWIRVAMGVAVLPCLFFAILHASAYERGTKDPSKLDALGNERSRPREEWPGGHWYLGMLWLGVAILLGGSVILWSISDKDARDHEAYRSRIDAEATERLANDHERFRLVEQGRQDAHLNLPYESSGLTGWRQEAWASGWREQKRGAK